MLWLGDIDDNLIAQVGGKALNLGKLWRLGFPTPEGFCVSSDSYRRSLSSLWQRQDWLEDLLALEECPSQDLFRLHALSDKIRHAIRTSPLDPELAQEVVLALKILDHPVAVRSSATAEDLPSASFAGQQESFLNLVSPTAVLQAMKDCWASLWTARAVAYRRKMRFDHRAVALAVVVQKMIRSEKSGIIFTMDPVSRNREEMIVEANWGLGESVVSGLVIPDSIRIRKRDLAILEESTGTKEQEVIPAIEGVFTRDTPRGRQGAKVLSREETSLLGRTALAIESRFGYPQDIEWAMERGSLYILQARPITTLEN